MTSKLTLTVDDSVIKQAKIYSHQNNISLSKIVELYFRLITADTKETNQKIPPITQELSTMLKVKTRKSEKKLLSEALIKKHL